MKKLLKNPVALGGIAIIIVIIIFVAAYFFIMKGSSQDASSQVPTTQAQQIQQIQPKDIGLTLTPRADNKAVILEITKLSGIKSLDYSVDYDADVKDPDTGEVADVPRGVEGTIDVKSSDSDIKREIELGTCSRNVCNYDNVISGVKFTIKVSYSDGHVAAVEQTVNLPGVGSNSGSNPQSGSQNSTGTAPTQSEDQ